MIGEPEDEARRRRRNVLALTGVLLLGAAWMGVSPLIEQRAQLRGDLVTTRTQVAAQRAKADGLAPAAAKAATRVLAADRAGGAADPADVLATRRYAAARAEVAKLEAHQLELERTLQVPILRALAFTDRITSGSTRAPGR